MAKPREVLNALYDLIGEPRFPHDFGRVEYDEPEFDGRINMPGLHRVSGPVEVRTRQTILPPDIFQQNNRAFWEIGDQNPRNVRVL